MLEVAPAAASRHVIMNLLKRVGSPAVEPCAIISYFDRFNGRHNANVFICIRIAPRKPRDRFNTLTNKNAQSTVQ